MKFSNTFLLFMLLTLAGCSSGSSSRPLPKKSKYAYVLNNGDSTISQYKVDASGELIALSPPTIATGSFPTAMAMDANQNYLYVVNAWDDTISQYAVGGDGALKEIAVPIATGAIPQGLALSPNGRHIYVMNLQGESISRYTIGANGELSLASTQSHSEGPMNLTFSLSGRFAYVVNGDMSISQFSVENGGALNPLTPSTIASSGCPSGPVSATKTAAGEFIYVLSCSTEEVEVFSIGASGTLTSQEVVKTGLRPQGMTVFEKNLYVANSGEGTVSMFAIQENGKLTALSQATVNAGDAPETLAMDEGGGSAYILDYAENKVLQYSVGRNGELTASQSHSVATGVSPIRILLKY